MRALRTWLLVLLTVCLAPAYLLAQELKTINKPGQMQSNVTTDDEKGKPLKLKKGEKVTVIYSRDDWMWVRTKGGRGGWVLKKEVKVNEAAAAAPAGKADDKKSEDKAAKKAAAEEAKKKKEEARAAKKAAAAEAKKKKEEEKLAKKAAADEAKKKKEEEKLAKQAAADEAKKKKEDEKAAAATAPAAGTPATTPGAAASPAAAAPVTTPAPADVTPGPAVTDAQPLATTSETPETAEPVPAPSDSAAAVAAAAPPVAAAPPPMASGFITVRASEPGAVVLLDGKRIGEAPVRKFAVDGGRHNITVVKDEFNPAWQDVEVNGNEVAVTLALAPYPAVLERYKRGVWRNWGIGLGALAAGFTLSLVSSAVGVAGALLWVASGSAIVMQKAQVNFNDPVSAALAPILGATPIPMFVGVALTVVAPMLALVFGLGGAGAAAALLMTAGDPGRYEAYQE